jgi:hypothetical protein
MPNKTACYSCQQIFMVAKPPPKVKPIIERCGGCQRRYWRKAGEAVMIPTTANELRVAQDTIKASVDD